MEKREGRTPSMEANAEQFIDPASVPSAYREWNSRLVLAGDIGGTNSRFVLFDMRGGPHCDEVEQGQGGTRVFQKRYLNHGFKTFLEVVQQFLKDAGGVQAETACFAVAGPVKDGVVVLTNIEGWVIDSHMLEQDLGIRKVVVINDFVGIGYGLLTLEDSECLAVNNGEHQPEAPILCVGAGTGLGECYLTYSKGTARYEVFPCEGGHTDFAANTPEQVRLRDFVMKKHGLQHRMSVERLVSGSGIAVMYEFLRSESPDQADEATSKAFDAAEPKDQPAVVTKAADDSACPLADRAVELFLELYGSEVGNCALKFMPHGGIYIAGGLMPKLLHRLKASKFMHAFSEKGRMSALARSIPLKVVKDQSIGMRGAKLMAGRVLVDLVNTPRGRSASSSKRPIPSAPRSRSAGSKGGYNDDNNDEEEIVEGRARRGAGSGSLIQVLVRGNTKSTVALASAAGLAFGLSMAAGFALGVSATFSLMSKKQ